MNTSVNVHDFYSENNCRLHICPGDAKYPAGTNEYGKTNLHSVDVQFDLWAGKAERYCWLLDDHHFCLDVDEHGGESGMESLRLLELEHGPLENQCEAILETPTGGRHYYWKLPSNAPIAMKRLDPNRYPAIDVLTPRIKPSCLVIGEDSTHPTAMGRYRWVTPEPKLIDLPGSLMGVMQGTVEDVSPPEDDRNRGLPGDVMMRSWEGVQLLAQLMSERGYRFRSCGDYYEWIRPGKTTKSDISGYLGKQSESGTFNLTCFSLSDPVFGEFQSQSITIFKALSLLKFEGDLTATTRWLRGQGYGVIDVEKMFSVIDSPDGESDILSDMPEIDVNPFNPRATVKQVLKCMALPGCRRGWIPDGDRDAVTLYHRNSDLVYVAPNDDQKSETKVRIYKLDGPLIEEAIGNAVGLYTRNKKGERVRTLPSVALIRNITTRQEYHGLFPNLDELITTPMILPDGTIVQEPGYHPDGRAYYAPNAEFEPVADDVSREDAIAAMGILLNPVSQFPFIDENDKAVYLSGLLSLVCRTAIPGGVPLHAISGNSAGVGKGLLAKTWGVIAYGKPVSATTYPKTSEEARKAISSVVMEGKPVLMLDNLDEALGNDALDAFLTSGHWTDRILGTNRMIDDVPVRTVVMATGNNLRVKADSSRRVVLCRLKTKLAEVENRPDLLHNGDALLSHIASIRGSLIRAALTIVKAYINAGRPDQGLTLGSFEDWAGTIASAITWIGGGDPLANRETIRQSDETAEMHLAILEAAIAMSEEVGKEDGRFTIKAINKIHEDNQWNSGHTDAWMEPAVDALRMSKYDIGRWDGVAFGKLLHEVKDKPIRGMDGKVRAATKVGRHARANIWAVIELG